MCRVRNRNDIILNIQILVFKCYSTVNESVLLGETAGFRDQTEKRHGELCAKQMMGTCGKGTF